MVKKIAEQLIERNFSYLDIDSDKLGDEVLWLLSKNGFFNELYDELVQLDDENNRRKHGTFDAEQ